MKKLVPAWFENSMAQPYFKGRLIAAIVLALAGHFLSLWVISLLKLWPALAANKLLGMSIMVMLYAGKVALFCGLAILLLPRGQNNVVQSARKKVDDG